ncbi:NlpC/P60 family protein [Streptomyces sp. NPDC058694]|uniref:C40 family peptidase n=1 Tax=Streptomyces sp. NPDC058694 TaxID=3346603 RepID=UPI00364AC104
MDLYSSAGGSSPAREDDKPSREEVQQRISSLYDQAETVSGNYNATRAMNSGRPRERVTPGPDAGRGRADTVSAPAPALNDRAKQWFDVGRSQLGPLIPAVLPPDRMPDRGEAAARPKSTGDRPGERSPDRALDAAAKPVLELTAGPGAATAARPVAELTAGPVAALPAVPQQRQDATAVMPALPAADPRQPLKTSKQRNQSKLAKARELLSAHTARRSAPVAAIEPAPAETAWATTEGQGYRQAEAEWWQQQPQPQSAGFGTHLSVDALGGPDLTLGMGLPAAPAPVPSIAPAPSIGMDLPMGPDLSFGMAPPVDARTPVGTGLPIGSDGASNPGYATSNPGYSAATPGYGGSTPGYGGKAATAVDFAREQIGKPCVWGAMGPGSYDCSSLTQAAWKAAGVALPRGVNDQATAGTAVPLSDIRLGDLVLFHGHIGHVGIYSGNGMMVHAPSPGAAIREESIHWAGESAIHSVIRPA